MFSFSLLFCIYIAIVQCIEDPLSPSDHKPGDYAMTIDPDCQPGECIGVSQLYYMYEYAAEPEATPTPWFRQTRQAFMTWVRRANMQGGLQLRDGSRRRIFLKSYYLSEPVGNEFRMFIEMIFHFAVFVCNVF
jgi:hypothetical protein